MSKNRILQASSVALLLGLCVSSVDAQPRYRERDRGWERVTRIEPGTQISVRTTQRINVRRREERVYSAVVDQDVRGQNGRIAIPRGSRVDLVVRAARDNDLILDLESVVVQGQRYGLDTSATRLDSGGDNLIGAIVGAFTGGQVRGPNIAVPRGSVLNFRLDRPMVMGAVRRYR
jgi:hypothetical protein